MFVEAMGFVLIVMPVMLGVLIAIVSLFDGGEGNG